jgi:hypothetical protein
MKKKTFSKLFFCQSQKTSLPGLPSIKIKTGQVFPPAIAKRQKIKTSLPQKNSIKFLNFFECCVFCSKKIFFLLRLKETKNAQGQFHFLLAVSFKKGQIATLVIAEKDQSQHFR